MGSHQDSVFLYTDPPSAVGFWFALEDCTATNGCLSFVPGSHKTHPIGKRFVRVDGGGTGFIEISKENEEPDPSAFKVEECPAGKESNNFTNDRNSSHHPRKCSTQKRSQSKQEKSIYLHFPCDRRRKHLRRQELVSILYRQVNTGFNQYQQVSQKSIHS